MFLRVPPQFIRSTHYVWKCHRIIYALNFLVYLFCYIIQFNLKKTSAEYTLWDMLDIFLEICTIFPFYMCFSFPEALWTDFVEEIRNGYPSFFVLPMIVTSFWTGWNIFQASGFYHTFKSCGFGYAYSGFIKGTLGGIFNGIISALFGISFVYLSLLDIKLMQQGYNLYRNLCDDRYRRTG